MQLEGCTSIMSTTEVTTIERKTLIHAARSRVWRALTTPREFSIWFAAEVNSPFKPGKRNDMVSTHPAGTGKGFSFTIERMEPEHTFSWRWHPGSANPTEDGDTLVEFHLEDAAEGTLVTVTETGFDRISLARRAKAFAENGRGWELQMDSLQQYVGREA